MSPKKNKGNSTKQVFSRPNDAKLIAQLFAAETVETMLEKDFYVVEFNISCRTRDTIFIPVEVGVVKFSIKDGIKDSFHDFINSGPIPLGYSASAKDLSNNYHGIPESFCHKNYNKFCEYIQETSKTDSEDYDTSNKEAVRKIDRFVQPETVVREAESGKPKANVRPVFSYPLTYEGVIQTDRCLNRLATQTNNASFYENFQVLDIVHLLKFACLRKSEKADRPYAVFDSAFSVKILDAPSEKLCQYHYEIDNSNCALGRAFAVAYCFLDHVCPHYPVVPTSNHLPPVVKSSSGYDAEWQASTDALFNQKNN